MSAHWRRLFGPTQLLCCCYPNLLVLDHLGVTLEIKMLLPDTHDLWLVLDQAERTVVDISFDLRQHTLRILFVLGQQFVLLGLSFSCLCKYVSAQVDSDFVTKTSNRTYSAFGFLMLLSPALTISLVVTASLPTTLMSARTSDRSSLGMLTSSERISM